jgi:hypothetical protein
LLVADLTARKAASCVRARRPAVDELHDLFVGRLNGDHAQLVTG